MRIHKKGANFLQSRKKTNVNKFMILFAKHFHCSQVILMATALFYILIRIKVGVSHFFQVDKYHTVHREVWPYPDRNYVAFTVKKRGQETMTIVSNLAHAVHRAPKMFSYYGTKDKRAITYQRVVAYRITPVSVFSFPHS